MNVASMPITIRPAVHADVEAIAGFQIAMARESEGKELEPGTIRKGVEAVLSSPEKGQFYVAEAGGSVVGSCMITYEWSDWRNGNFWWFQSVYVLPERRRKGVYRALHSYVHQQALSRDDVCGLRLYVAEDNRAARRTYESMGMKKSHYLMYEIDFGAG